MTLNSLFALFENLILLSKKYNILITSFFKHKFLSLKKSFTLVELSIVIIIISVILSIVLASKTFININRINKIYEEFRMYNNSIQLFYDQYGCLPGDCSAMQIPDLTANISASCTIVNTTTGVSSVYNLLNSGMIESSAKRTCMFQELQAAGYLSSGSVSNLNTGLTLTDSVAGVNIPYAKFNKKSAWDYRSIQTGVNSFCVLSPPSISSAYNSTTTPGINCANGNGYGTFSFIVTYNPAVNSLIIPMELASPDLQFIGNNSLILRDANTTAGLTTDITISEVNGINGLSPSVSSSMAQKLDLKFDDGMPYSGYIAGGLPASGTWGLFNSCNTFSLSGTIITTGAVYYSTNNIKTGCILAFLIKNIS